MDLGAVHGYSVRPGYSRLKKLLHTSSYLCHATMVIGIVGGKEYKFFKTEYNFLILASGLRHYWW